MRAAAGGGGVCGGHPHYVIPPIRKPNSNLTTPLKPKPASPKPFHQQSIGERTRSPPAAAHSPHRLTPQAIVGKMWGFPQTPPPPRVAAAGNKGYPVPLLLDDHCG